MGTLTHKTHHGLDSREATTFPHIVFSATLRGGYIQMALFPGTPKLKSRNCPEIVPIGVSRLWALVTPDYRVWSQRGLNQSCSPCQDLSNAMSHSLFKGWEEVDSRLLVVESQTASLTPGPSFVHNLGCKCPNDQCEAIFEYLIFETFSMTPRTLQCEVFWAFLSSSKHLGVPEDSKSPTLGVGVSSSHLTQSKVATFPLLGVWVSSSHLLQSEVTTTKVEPSQEIMQ